MAVLVGAKQAAIAAKGGPNALFQGPQNKTFYNGPFKSAFGAQVWSGIIGKDRQGGRARAQKWVIIVLLISFQRSDHPKS